MARRGQATGSRRDMRRVGSSSVHREDGREVLQGSGGGYLRRGGEVDAGGCCSEPAKGAEELAERSIRKEWKKKILLERNFFIEKPRL